MARSEYWSCPLRLPTPAAAHVAIASGVSQRVTSPRRTRARSYSAQVPTRYVQQPRRGHLGPHRVTPVGCRVPRGLATEPGPSQQGLGRPAEGQVRRLRPAVPAAGHRIHDMVRGGASESRQPRLRQRIGGHTRHRRRRAGTGRVHRPHRDGVRLPIRQARHRFLQVAARVDPGLAAVDRILVPEDRGPAVARRGIPAQRHLRVARLRPQALRRAGRGDGRRGHRRRRASTSRVHRPHRDGVRLPARQVPRDRRLGSGHPCRVTRRITTPRSKEVGGVVEVRGAAVGGGPRA